MNNQELLYEYMNELFEYYIDLDIYTSILDDFLTINELSDITYDDIHYNPIFTRDIIKNLCKKKKIIYNPDKSIFSLLVELQKVILNS